MKINTHILFLIIVIGIISAGIVGASFMNSDTSMKQEVFDGITVSVPSNSNFVKVGDGVYKDENNGITITTFKNNNSMIDFLKNTKKSKIVPLENQPPQSVAFKKGNSISILVTNGKEGMSISTNDGKLTSKMANSIVFSNHQQSSKPSGISFVHHPKMDNNKDFDLILPLIVEVNTTVFDVDVFQNNTFIVVDDFNENVVEEESSFNPLAEDSVSDVEENNIVESLFSDGSSSDDSSSSSDSGILSPTKSHSNSDDSSDDSDSSSDDSSDDSSSDEVQKISYDECRQVVEQGLPSNLAIDHYEEVGDSFVFYIVDMEDNNAAVGDITVNALTGDVQDHLTA